MQMFRDMFTKDPQDDHVSYDANEEREVIKIGYVYKGIKHIDVQSAIDYVTKHKIKADIYMGGGIMPGFTIKNCNVRLFGNTKDIDNSLKIGTVVYGPVNIQDSNVIFKHVILINTDIAVMVNNSKINLYDCGILTINNCTVMHCVNSIINIAESDITVCSYFKYREDVSIIKLFNKSQFIIDRSDIYVNILDIKDCNVYIYDNIDSNVKDSYIENTFSQDILTWDSKNGMVDKTSIFIKYPTFVQRKLRNSLAYQSVDLNMPNKIHIVKYI